MKPQCSCLTMFGSTCAYGAPWLAGAWWRPDDVVRLARFMVRPLLVAIVVVAVGAALLLGGRSLAPFVIGGPGQLTAMSAERESAERELRAETARLLESFESPHAPALPAGGERP